MSVKKVAKKPARNSGENDEKSGGFTDEEKAAMKARVQEMKAEARAIKDKAEGEKVALAAIAAMKDPDRSMAKRLHAIIKESAPTLLAKTWYGMPAYANRDDKVVCFFRDRYKFKERYAMLGFNDTARLDDGDMWPVAYALKELTAKEEARIVGLLKKAVG